MNRSTEIGQLMLALSAAQGQMVNAAKDSANPFFKSSYADLASVWAACRGPLASNGLAVVQLPRAAGKVVTVETVLAHASGEWISDELTTTAKDDSPQSMGSAITYVRRYALSALVGIAPDDDDGEGAQGRAPAAKPYVAPAGKRVDPKVVAAAMAHVERVTAPAAAQTVEAKVVPAQVAVHVEAPPPPVPAPVVVEPAHDPVTGEVFEEPTVTLADVLTVRIGAARNIRPDLTGIAADIEDALKRGLLRQFERDSLFALLTARKAVVLANAAARAA